jgi:hypothetical protein
MSYPVSNPEMSGDEPSATEQAKEQVQQVAERAQDLAGDVQVKLREQADTRSTQIGAQVAATALALRSGADELYRQGNDSAGEAAHRAAAQAERLGSYLQASDSDRRGFRATEPVGGGHRGRGRRSSGGALPEGVEHSSIREFA